MRAWVGLVGLCGCASLTPYEHKLIDCSSQAVESQIPSLLPLVQTALAKPQAFQTSQALDALLMTGGEAAVCALEATVVALEGRISGYSVSGAVAAGVPVAVQLVRAESYLQAEQWTRGHRAGMAVWGK